jgi:hypothetical protein
MNKTFKKEDQLANTIWRKKREANVLLYANKTEEKTNENTSVND